MEGNPGGGGKDGVEATADLTTIPGKVTSSCGSGEGGGVDTDISSGGLPA